MLPRERSLVERLKNEPFALLGINSDGGAEALRKILQKERISWRQAADGTTRGPLATKWGVRSWPTVYVLDTKGVIRFIQPENLDEVVLALVADANAVK